jgi:putative transcriptional regulator
LRDGIFDHSVVLITHHSVEDGAHGVILNHPDERTVGDLFSSPEFDPVRALKIFQGGPVAQDQLAFAAFSWTSSRGLRSQISLSLEKAIALSRQPGTLVRAFVGYSGWSAGQLESELARNAWTVVKPGHDLLGLDHSRSLWAGLMGRISPYHRILSVAPSQPWLN